MICIYICIMLVLLIYGLVSIINIIDIGDTAAIQSTLVVAVSTHTTHSTQRPPMSPNPAQATPTQTSPISKPTPHSTTTTRFIILFCILFYKFDVLYTVMHLTGDAP